MDLEALQTLIGDLTNDPNHDRYSIAQINQELDNSQNEWNIHAKLIVHGAAIQTIAGRSYYPILEANINGLVIGIRRVTHKGIDLVKVDRAYLDMYTGHDWTQDTGTPKKYFLSATEPGNQAIWLYPQPTSNDLGLIDVLAVIQHQTLSDPAGVPFTDYLGASNEFLRPYDWGLAYHVAAKLLLRDPSEINALKAASYRKIASNVLLDLVQVFGAFEKEEPMRLKGGRYWGSSGALSRI